MCGIVGYCGKNQAASALLSGLEGLEYRGYDSCGIAICGNPLSVIKAKGRIARLKRLCNQRGISGSAGIGHTRWATHGAPTTENAHPFLSFGGSFAVVHNGIIENYTQLKNQLIGQGVSFTSDTDSEVIAHLLEKNYHGDVASAISKTASLLRGWYAIAVVCRHHQGKAFAIKNRSPLLLGLGEGFNMLASDQCVLCSCKSVYAMQDNQLAVISKDKAILLDQSLKPIEISPTFAPSRSTEISKEGFDSFMLKEIYAQPEIAQKLSISLLQSSCGQSLLSSITATVDKIDLVGCGSAYFSALSGAHALRDLCKIPSRAINAGEYAYSNPVTNDKTLTVAISQSGETADTICAVTHAKSLNSRTISIVNNDHSTLARITSHVISQNAGVEIAVATTKGYTTQLVALYCLALSIASDRLGLRFESLRSALTGLEPAMREVLDSSREIRRVASEISGCKHAFFIGRAADYYAALEGALKLKEISYLHAEAYSASELKHGSIALISKGVPVIALCLNPALESKMISSIREVKARGATVFALTSRCCASAEKECDLALTLPDFPPLFSPLIAAPALQLLAYHTATILHRDVDKPRNLAKSVTVE